MLFRKIFSFVFASPITIIFSVVSISCIGILAVKITSNMAPLNEADGTTISDKDNTGVSFQNDGFSSEEISYEGSLNVEKSGDLNSRFQPPGYAPGQAGDSDSTSRNNFNPDRESIDRDTIDRGWSRGDDSGRVARERVDRNRSAESVNNPSTSVNFSTSNNSNSASTASGSNTSSSIDSTSIATTDNGSVITDPVVTPTPDDNEFPASLDYEVKTSPEETQTIFCQPVVANGPPCKCIFTMTDEDGSISKLVDNCS